VGINAISIDPHWPDDQLQLTDSASNASIPNNSRARRSCIAIAFSVAGPTVCKSNSLPDSLRDPALTSNSFRQSLKTNLFSRSPSTQSAVEMLHDSALYISITDIDIDSTHCIYPQKDGQAELSWVAC